MDKVSELQQAVFDRGTDIGKLAQELFPGGVDASPQNVRRGDIAVETTKELIADGQRVIYEAGFIHDDILVYSDIIVNENDGWKIYEVKSSTGITETYLWDVAVQFYVLSGAGLKVSDISLVYINNEYVRKGEIEIQKLFLKESVLKDIEHLLPLVESHTRKFKQVINRPEMPDIDIGEHCTNPYRCGFFNYCWNKIPEDSIFEISNMHLKKKFELYRDGIIKLDDIPEEMVLSKNHKIQVDAYKNNSAIIEKEEIEEFLTDFKYPLYFMDFESFQPAVPLYDNSRPYQQIPFQFSIHLLENKDAELKHYEYLGDPNNDPRKPFIDKLVQLTGDNGSIVVYNKAFENTRLREIVRDYPQYAEGVEKIIERVVDLMIPFQKKYYYMPAMKGSFSIKSVLPALVPELSYKDMEIGDGGTASVSFENILSMDDMFEIEKIRNNLLEYCKLDTLAMVKIYEKLRDICK
nr:DUF2779 domain-containing protein [uncultured Sphaerochaeta sp.]